MTTELTMLLFFRARRVRASSLESSSTKSIALVDIFAYLHVCQRKIKSGSDAGFTFGPDPATVPCDDPSRGCQPDAGSLKFASAVKSLEWTEQPAGIFHVKTRTVVANEKGRFFLKLDLTEFD